MKSTRAIRALASGILISTVLWAAGAAAEEGHHYASMDAALAAASAAGKPLLIDFGTSW